MKSSMILLVLALWVSAAFSSQGIPPPAKVNKPVSVPSYYETHYSQDREVEQVKQTTGAQVSLHSKVIPPQTGPTVTFTQTSYQKPVVQQHYASGQYGGSVTTTTTQFGGQYNQQETLTNRCNRPRALLNFDFDKTVTKGTWYFPLLHKNDLNNIYRTTYGYDLRTSENINNVCLRNDWTADEVFVQFFGRGDVASGQIACKSIDNGAGSECSLIERNSVNPVKFYGVKTDNKNYVLISTCWKSGENGWVLFSQTPTISYSVKQEILAEVKALGFNSFDTKELSYTSCSIGQAVNTVVNTFGQTNTYETKVQETANHFGQRPTSTVFSQTQHVVRPATFVTEQKTVYQPQTQFVFEKEVVTKYANCKVPSDYQLADITWRSNTDSFYYPLIHENDFNNFYKIVFGRGLRSSEDVSAQCLRNHWSVKNRGISSVRSNLNTVNELIYTIVGAGKTSEEVVCKQIGNKWSYECNPVQGEAFRLYTIKTDNSKYALSYTCWESGTIGWTLYSDTPTVTLATKQEILRQVRTLGFSDKYDIYFELRYDTCAVPKVHEYESTQAFTSHKTIYQQQTKYVVEKEQDKYVSGSVSLYANCKVPTDYQLVDLRWGSQTKDFYYPLIHQTDYNNFYRTVFGRDLRANDDTSSICLNTRWNYQYPSSLKNSLFNVYSADQTSKDIICKQIGNRFAYDCTNELGENYRQYVLKTDHRNWALSYTCWESGLTSWNVISDTPTISQVTKDEILRKVATLGFEADDYLDINYDRCNAQVLLKPATTFTSTIHQTKPATTFTSTVHQTKPATTFTSTVHQTKPFVSTFTQERETTSYIKPAVQQQQNTYVFGKEQDKYVSGEISLYANCKVPTDYQLVDLRWGSQNELFYYPLIHQTDYNNFYRAVFGRDLRANDDTNSICLNTRWNYQYPSSLKNSIFNVYSADQTSKAINCKQIGNKFAYDCTNELGQNYRQYVLKTDHRNWALSYTCWESGLTSWNVISDTPTISEFTKQDVLRKVQTLGFEANDYLDISYESCNQQLLTKPLTTFTSTVTKPATTFTSTVHQTKPATTFQSNVHQTKPFVSTFTQERETTSYVKPAVHQQTSTYFQRQPVEFKETTTVVKQPVVHTTTIVKQPEVHVQTTTFSHQRPTQFQETTTFVKQPAVQTSVFSHQPAVQTSIFSQKPAVQTSVFSHQPAVQTSIFSQKPAVQTNIFSQKPAVQTSVFSHQPAVQTSVFSHQRPATQYKETTTFVQKPAVHQTTTTFTENRGTFGSQKVSGYYQPTVVKTNVVYSGIRASKYQHCNIPPLSEIADSPLAETNGVRNQADLPLQEQYFYFPLSQRTTLNSVNKFVFGRALSAFEQVNSLCYGSKFSWTGKDKDIFITFYSKGLYNNRSSEQIVCRQEDSTKWLGECVSATGETFLAYVVRDDFKEGEANGFIGNFCWESGQTSWNFFSTEKTVPAEDKEIVLREVSRLGYSPEDYVELSYTQCPRDVYEESLQTRFFHRKDKYQTNYEVISKVPVTSFSTCKRPKNYLKRYNFESSTFAEGVEYFDLVMMHESEPQLLNNLLRYNKNFNLRRDKDAACYRVRTDYTDNISHKVIGFRDQVSDNIQCTQQGNEHNFNCASKVTGNSYEAYGIKSDSSTWELIYKCWETGKETWDVLAKPGTILTESLKRNILREVEALGFNPNEYVEFDHDKCEFNRNLFSGYERDCDCCKVKKFF